MADLTHEQIEAWERWFQNLDPVAREGRPAGFYALTDMAHSYLKARDKATGAFCPVDPFCQENPVCAWPCKKLKPRQPQHSSPTGSK